MSQVYNIDNVTWLASGYLAIYPWGVQPNFTPLEITAETVRGSLVPKTLRSIRKGSLCLQKLKTLVGSELG